jgi:SAM-dependent methyltransferase
MNSVDIRCTVASAEELPYPAGSFDLVWGNAILHHLDLARAGRELFRVMKPGAIAVFCEPWGGNPFLSFARRRLPYPGKRRTPDERPLVARDLEPLRAIFPTIEMEGAQLLGMLRRVWKVEYFCRFLDRLDRGLLRLLPSLANWCRYAILTLRKPAT